MYWTTLISMTYLVLSYRWLHFQYIHVHLPGYSNCLSLYVKKSWDKQFCLHVVSLSCMDFLLIHIWTHWGNLYLSLNLSYTFRLDEVHQKKDLFNVIVIHVHIWFVIYDLLVIYDLFVLLILFYRMYLFYLLYRIYLFYMIY